MPKILSGIGQAIGPLFGVEPKPVDETLEGKINNALAEEREKIRPTREDIDTFSWITKDNNPVHRLKKRAVKLNFDDIPVMGAHVAAYGEQFIEGVVQNMREYWGADIKIIGQDNKFKAALHPGERTLWQINGFSQKDSIIELKVTGSKKVKGETKQVVSITSRLGNEYDLMPQIAGPIYIKRYKIEPEHLEEFYTCVGAKNTGKVPNMLPASFVPATLLQLLEDKTYSFEGINREMNFNIMRESKPGTLQVNLFAPEEPKEIRGQFKYSFKSVVSQDSRPVAFGEMVCLTQYQIDPAHLS